MKVINAVHGGDWRAKRGIWRTMNKKMLVLLMWFLR